MQSLDVTLVVVLVNRIVAHRHRRTVARRRAVVRIEDVVEVEHHAPLEAAPLTVVRIERQTVGRGILPGQAERVHAQLRLHEVKEAQRLGLGARLQADTGLRCGIDIVEVVVVAEHRPVNHVFAVGQPAVVHHHLLRPRLLRGLAVVEPVDAAVAELHRVVALGTRDGLRCLVKLQGHHVGDVLHHVAGLTERTRLARIPGRVHADVVGQSGGLGHVAQLGGIDDITARRLLRLSADGIAHSPPVAAAPQALERYVGLIGEARLCPDPLLEDGVAHRRLKLDVAHPTGGEGLERTVVFDERLLEVAPHARRQAEIAVGGTHARAGEHAAKPWRGVDEQRLRPEACTLYGCAYAARSAAHHYDVVALGLGG